jgi:phosphatidylserine/phosphatidylglycerophosphate/cardiolipin synthase-like enzyme
MPNIVSARAWCNNEVAYLAWKTDGKIDGCLGFMITRVDVDTGERKLLPSWVAFDTQSNPNWEEQDTSVWPIQKFSWRDLTLRRSRNSLVIHDRFHIKYEVVPVGLKAQGRQPVPPSPTAQPGKYKGTPIPLFICGKAVETNEIEVTSDFGNESAYFNNGILSTQYLRKQLETPVGKAPSADELKKKHLFVIGDAIRDYLSGDVLPALRTIFDRAAKEDGTVHLALYELSDPELIKLLVANQARLNLILTTAGNSKPKKGSGEKVQWDTTNTDARKTLSALMKERLQNRMFNNSAHIGHNKFAVLLDRDDKPIVVWTGSTNWTPTGVCAQSNNTIVIESDVVAKFYFDYWNRLHDDKLPIPKPLSAPLNDDQGQALRTANTQSNKAAIDGGKTNLELWCSPNTPKTGTPKNRTVPPDLAMVFALMKQAKHAIFFLVFNPGRSDPEGEDVNTVVSAGIEFGRLDPKLTVFGAISDPTAVPGYQPAPKDQKKDKSAPKIPNLAIFSPAGAPNVLMIRAAAINDLIGDFQKELLSAGNAIIHDKIVVIDPLSKNDCVVITGSHNLGFKASYANDENLIILRGNQPLALAYTVHVLDIYDHYKFRAALEQQARDAMLKGKPKPKQPTGKGFLQHVDAWQEPYLSGEKGRELAYFLS